MSLSKELWGLFIVVMCCFAALLLLVTLAFVMRKHSELLEQDVRCSELCGGRPYVLVRDWGCACLVDDDAIGSK